MRHSDKSVTWIARKASGLLSSRFARTWKGRYLQSLLGWYVHNCIYFAFMPKFLFSVVGHYTSTALNYCFWTSIDAFSLQLLLPPILSLLFKTVISNLMMNRPGCQLRCLHNVLFMWGRMITLQCNYPHHHNLDNCNKVPNTVIYLAQVHNFSIQNLKH